MPASVEAGIFFMLFSTRNVARIGIASVPQIVKYTSFGTFFLFFTLVLLWPAGIYSQSRDQNFPSPISSNEIAGTIPARDIGDARLTSYFYTFEGGQGDIFINVVTKNLTGNIDVFTADKVQPLTKIVVYAESPQGETGRVIYLRRPARLLLRVEGRTPNDDPATFRIKFAGSFIAMAASEKDETPVVDRAEKADESAVRVNSVGTIIERPTKPKDPVKTSAVAERNQPETEPDRITKVEETPAEKVGSDIEIPKVRITPAPDVKTAIGGRASRSKPPAKKNAPAKAAEAASSAADVEKLVPESKADPLASINLVITLKDGGVVEHPMNQVFRFSVDKGILTVITKDRKTRRFSILDVEKVTIQ
jgi:hypothetical protein